MSDATNIPPGWYPDSTTPGSLRWWDGAQWTEHVHTPAGSSLQFAAPTAPAGTNTTTAWIWLVVLLPLLSIVSLFAIDMTGYLRQSLAHPGSSTGSMLGLITSPGYLLALVLGWGSTAAIILFAYLDWRTLKRRGVPAPFHWAFIFLIFASAGIVYPIGRSVAVKRQAGGSRAPMWVAIAVYALLFIVSIGWTVTFMIQVFSMIPSYSVPVT